MLLFPELLAAIPTLHWRLEICLAAQNYAHVHIMFVLIMNYAIIKFSQKIDLL